MAKHAPDPSIGLRLPDKEERLVVGFPARQVPKSSNLLVSMKSDDVPPRLTFAKPAEQLLTRAELKTLIETVAKKEDWPFDNQQLQVKEAWLEGTAENVGAHREGRAVDVDLKPRALNRTEEDNQLKQLAVLFSDPSPDPSRAITWYKSDKKRHVHVTVKRRSLERFQLPLSRSTFNRAEEDLKTGWPTFCDGKVQDAAIHDDELRFDTDGGDPELVFAGVEMSAKDIQIQPRFFPRSGLSLGDVVLQTTWCRRLTPRPIPRGPSSEPFRAAVCFDRSPLAHEPLGSLAPALLDALEAALRPCPARAGASGNGRNALGTWLEAITMHYSPIAFRPHRVLAGQPIDVERFSPGRTPLVMILDDLCRQVDAVWEWDASSIVLLPRSASALDLSGLIGSPRE